MTLMRLLKRYLQARARDAHHARHPLPGHRPAGRPRPGHPAGTRRAREATASCRGMLFNIALNYGGRAEIVDAARRAIELGLDPASLDEAAFRRPALHRGAARPRPADPHERRTARQQLPAVADRVRGDPRHRRAVARLPLPPPARGGARLPETGPPLRRPQAPRPGARRQVTRLLSGLVDDRGHAGRALVRAAGGVPARCWASILVAACVELTDLMLRAGVRMSADAAIAGSARGVRRRWPCPRVRRRGFLLVGTMLVLLIVVLATRTPAPDVPGRRRGCGVSRHLPRACRWRSRP